MNESYEIPQVPRDLLATLTLSWQMGLDFHEEMNQLRAILAAPAVERQEPVKWERKSKMHDGNWYALPPEDLDEAKRNGYEIRALYTSPPAPVAVVLPERMEYHRFGQVLTVSNAHVDGWNACLDKVKEMNA